MAIHVVLALFAMFFAQSIVTAFVTDPKTPDLKTVLGPSEAAGTAKHRGQAARHTAKDWLEPVVINDPTSVVDFDPIVPNPAKTERGAWPPDHAGQLPPWSHREQWTWILLDMAIGATVAAIVKWLDKLALRRAIMGRAKYKPERVDAATQTPTHNLRASRGAPCAADDRRAASPVALSRSDTASASTSSRSDWDGHELVSAAPAQWDELQRCAARAAQCVSDWPPYTAARKLISNHTAVLCDATNPLPKSQRGLARCSAPTPDAVQHADQALREVARRLLGPAAEGHVAPAEVVDPGQARVWCELAAFLMARTQSRPEECVGRDPDLDEDAAAAFRRELQGVWRDAFAFQLRQPAGAAGGAPAPPLDGSVAHQLKTAAFDRASARLDAALGGIDEEPAAPTPWEPLLSQLGGGAGA